jgi:hypothetical protein
MDHGILNLEQGPHRSCQQKACTLIAKDRIMPG